MRSPLASGLLGERQIQNSTRNLYLRVFPLVLTFAKAPAATGCERQDRTASIKIV
jgi:hypothetical protein